MTHATPEPHAPDRPRQAHLDGLRALSILPVLLAHAYPRLAEHPPVWLNAPFAGAGGVDVFFVISGYIITTLLLDERRDTGTLRIGAFYVRRFAKLVPVLWVYTGAVFLLARDPRPTTLEFGAALTLTSGFFARSWYLAHFWSLTVEEVSYVTWAPMLRWLSIRSATIAAWAAVALGIVVRTLNAGAVSPRLSASFAWWSYVPVLENIDSVAIGGLVALYRTALVNRIPRLSTMPVWIASLITLVVFQVAVAPYPQIGWRVFNWILIPLRQPMIGAGVGFLILVAGTRDGRTWLSRPLLAGIGRASYSIYIIQQAICIPLHLRTGAWWHSPPLSVGLAILAGVAIHRGFEDPMRRWLVKRLGAARPAA